MLRANLFLKVFLWFWLIVVLVGATLELSTSMIRRDEERWLGDVGALLPSEAMKAAEVFERSGKAGLEKHLTGLDGRHAVRSFLFDADNHSILDSKPPAVVLAVLGNAAEAARMEMPALSARDGVAAWRVTAASGRHYTLALLFLRAPIHSAWLALGRSPALRVLALLILGGILSFLLAHHITAPLRRLREAAGRIAKGEFRTRVSPDLGGRRDEIAWLAHDFDEMAERIQGLMVAQRNLLGDVSHELRSPLARLVVSLGILRRCPQEEAEEYHDRIKLEADRLDRLIGQLLTLTRLESGAEASVHENFDLTNLVEEIAADGDFEGRAQDRRVTILRADPCAMSGMVEALRSAIENVIRNALRYTPAFTAVEVTLQNKPGSITILSVRDRGPGVSADLLRDMFLPFRRGEAGQDGAGAGLGLAITDRVVRMHGGQVRASNAADGGLVVEIELPTGMPVVPSTKVHQG